MSERIFSRGFFFVLFFSFGFERIYSFVLFMLLSEIFLFNGGFWMISIAYEIFQGHDFYGFLSIFLLFGPFGWL